MPIRVLSLAAVAPIAVAGALALSGLAVPMPATATLIQEDQDDATQVLVSRLTLDNYKTTLKGLTQFGDRRQGTQRNRDAVDWIEAQLQAVGCDNTERITYEYNPEPRENRGGRGRRVAAEPPDLTTPTGGIVGRNGNGPGGSSVYGYRARTGVNRDLDAQPDERIRELNREEPVNGMRTEVYCTKIGTTRPNEMYIIGAHMDGHGVNEAVNDDGSGTALVMELARVLNAPDVETEVSIRFALWNNEETGTNGAEAYVEQRRALQGIESPAGSGQYPEPTWLGMIQHDMMMWDHGNPVTFNQALDADVDVEFQLNSAFAGRSAELGLALINANRLHATDYPAVLSNAMSNTDSRAFMDLVPSVSLRENRRLYETGNGANPHWHQTTDLFETFSDADFMLGLNAAQTTLGALAKLAGIRIKD